MKEPHWASVDYPEIDYQDISYYSAPKTKKSGPKSLEEVDEEVLKTFERLGISLAEQKGLQVLLSMPFLTLSQLEQLIQSYLKNTGSFFALFQKLLKNTQSLLKNISEKLFPTKTTFLLLLTLLFLVTVLLSTYHLELSVRLIFLLILE